MGIACKTLPSLELQRTRRACCCRRLTRPCCPSTSAAAARSPTTAAPGWYVCPITHVQMQAQRDTNSFSVCPLPLPSLFLRSNTRTHAHTHTCRHTSTHSLQVCQGGAVPPSFYMSPDGDELDHMSAAHVAHGEKLRLQFAVTNAGCILRSDSCAWDRHAHTHARTHTQRQIQLHACSIYRAENKRDTSSSENELLLL